MSAFAFVLLMMLIHRQYGGGAGASPTSSLAAQAAHAQIEATVKNTEAKGSRDPAKHKAAAQAQAKADSLTKAAQQQHAAKAVPPPWPQAMPSGLPPFPSGWQTDQPPPAAVQARAWQLLPILWKQGARARKTEQTAGRWITYEAQPMGAKKGVVAYRVRPGAMPSGPAPRNIA